MKVRLAFWVHGSVLTLLVVLIYLLTFICVIDDVNVRHGKDHGDSSCVYQQSFMLCVLAALSVFSHLLKSRLRWVPLFSFLSYSSNADQHHGR